MWKKIILGITISTIVLTVSAGGIYAYQKNLKPANNLKTQSTISNKIKETNCKEMQYKYIYNNKNKNNYNYNYNNCNNIKNNFKNNEKNKNKSSNTKNCLNNSEDCLNQNQYKDQCSYCYKQKIENKYSYKYFNKNNNRNCVQNVK